MRNQLIAFGIALAVALIVFLVLLEFGFSAIAYAAAIAAAVGLLIFGSIVMATNATHLPRELVKQIIVWLGIVVLLPLSVWYGTSTFAQTPKWKEQKMAAEAKKKESNLLQEGI